MEQIEFLSYIMKNLVTPLMTVFAVLIAAIVALKKGIIFKKKDKIEDINVRKGIIGEEGIGVNISTSDFQKIAYDPDKFHEYHQQSITQSRVSFWFSLIFATVGFLIIATSIFTYSDKTGYIGIIAGTIIDAVSALFFVQSNKARQLMSDFFDRLRQDRKLEESLKLCESINDEFLRNATKVKLSLFFSGLVDSHNTASEIISIKKDSNTDTSIIKIEKEDTEQENAAVGKTRR